MIPTLFIFLATGTALWYLGVILLLYRGLFSLRDPEAAGNRRFSVVIAARNEASNIGNCLESVLSQSIPPERFEVVVVNDRSTDETEEIIGKFEKRFSNLSHVTIDSVPSGISPKKWAVEQGAAKTKNEIIVFTDADCTVPSSWLATIDLFFTSDVGAVQGITSYRYIAGMNELFFKLQSLDFLSHGIVSAAAIGAGIPINSNANNLAVRRSAYLEVGGLSGKIGRIVSGDDDLLLQKIWKSGKWKIVFMANRKGVVETMPTPDLKTLFYQRARWGSKTIHYQPKQVILLSGVFCFYAALTATFFFWYYNQFFIILTSILILVKFAGECFLMIPGLRRFGKRELIPFLPIASILHLPLVLIAVAAGIFGKFTWKGQLFSRTIK